MPLGAIGKGQGIMLVRTMKLLCASSLITFACGPVAAGEFATKDEAVAMVKDAVNLIKQQGPNKAYSEISDKRSRFHDRDLYITVLAIDGKVLAHGQFENLIGQSLIDAKDPDGTLFVKERMELARQQPSFWQ